MIDRLFIPLNAKWYDLFKAGHKTIEIRGVNGRFNPKTANIGRRVELRRGYGKKNVLWGTITNIYLEGHIYDFPRGVLKKALPIDQSDWRVWEEIDLYNKKYGQFIAIEIRMEAA